jgi:hypothetical protein
MTFTELAPATSDPPEPFTDRLRLAVAAYLARFKGSSREHTESDLHCRMEGVAWHAHSHLPGRVLRPSQYPVTGVRVSLGGVSFSCGT